MSETEQPVEPVVTAWRAIAASHAAACAALEREMGKRHGLGVSEFEVLDRLAESGSSDIRSQELAEAVHLSQSALSRLIDRLESGGLVERCLCGEDRRGIYVTLTPAGRDRHAGGAHPPQGARLLSQRGSYALWPRLAEGFFVKGVDAYKCINPW